MQTIGEIGIDPKNPNYGEYWTGNWQEIYAEVTLLYISTKSPIINVDIEEKPKVLDNGRSPWKMEKSEVGKASSTCICQEQYKDLIWGAKVSCEFRKKVVQICAELWGESRKMDMANGLMAVMSVETNGSFKAHQLEGVNSLKSPQEMTIKDFWKKGNRKSSRAVGLIQFTQDALQNSLKEYSSNARLSVEEKFDELNNLKLQYAQMGEVNQLDKVKKYFEPQKEKIKSPEDIYLAVFAPKGIGKDDEYSLYTKHLVPKTKMEIEENKNYEANKSVDIENRGKKNGNDGVIQRAEILGRYRIKYTEGLQNKESHFNCGKIEISKNKPTRHNNKWRHPLDLMELRGWYSIWAPERSIYGKNIVGRTKGKHDGLDLYAPVGTAIYACVDGKVADNYISVSYGNVLILRGKYNGKTYYFFHAHMKEKSPLEKEADVSAGDIIGYTGKTGNASSLSSKQTHLHFEVKTKNTHAGNTVDPLSTISELKRDVNKNPNKETQK
ncbi:M23 family metallopeptidase [Chryseobacterium polytrichastri]|uniref:Peptidase family M23 n=1 Tax=Chryseobacterium polytrichastri TaxID=1302687 RepID=A0A1M7JPA4_9FLAO|nr:M23 family metallopeptidase [Chryseobacterium polytrichastri]SHM54735.1 Peptidase family M23 [Chryseobacterium polytrichastri]